MRIYAEKEKHTDINIEGLDRKEKIARNVAIVIAFISVFVFFFKILFF